jgi:signal transduction histidine kinase
MRFLGELRAVIAVGPKHHAALYTSEDLALLSTIATVGAIAFQHVRTLDQLEATRRLEVDVTRDEKRQALALVAAEVAHEVAYPLNFFRHLLRRAAEGRGIGEPDLDIGREEVERLERILGNLRRLKPPPRRIRSVNVRVAVQRAVELLRYLFEERRVGLVIDVEEDLWLLCEEDSLLQIFANLLRNALQAVADGGQVGIRSSRNGAGRVLEVWDDGPGIPAELRDAVFNVSFSTKPGGSGLGLAVVHRITRSFGWSIAANHDGRTRLVITVPDTAVATPTERK